jgi:drug/metabolite transporter (DMT)-like permease
MKGSSTALAAADRRRGPLVVLAVGAVAIAFAGILVAALLLGEELWPRRAAGWIDLLGLALICQVAGQSMVAWALAQLPSSFAAVALLVNPVSATILAWVILSEPAGPQQIVGGVIVLTGILLARSRETAPTQVAKTAA